MLLVSKVAAKAINVIGYTFLQLTQFDAPMSELMSSKQRTQF